VSACGVRECGSASLAGRTQCNMSTILSWVASLDRVDDAEADRVELVLDRHLQATAVAAVERILGRRLVLDVVARTNSVNHEAAHTHTERDTHMWVCAYVLVL